MFKTIRLRHWRQFENVDINLHTRMTVLTGQNGTGKTTLLNVLSRHFGWALQFVSTPLPFSKKRAERIWSDVWEVIESETIARPGAHPVGTITYADNKECQLVAPPQASQAPYQLTYQHQQPVLGIHIPSHMPSYSYHRVQHIPVDPKTSEQQYQAYQQLLQQFYIADRGQNPAASLKQSLIGLAVFGYGSEAVLPNPSYREMFEQFQGVLRILLPKNLGFRRLEIRIPDIVFVTESGDFALDAASGGIGALVGIAWQVFMYGQDRGPFVATIDEPESHLHPRMQRELLPNLFEAFPKTQFIIATHSPFIVTSAPDAHVYALAYNAAKRVESSLLDAADLSGTANTVLREILGVPMTVPLWVEQKFDQILAKYENAEMTLDRLRDLKQDLLVNNLGSYLPEALRKIGGGNA